MKIRHLFIAFVLISASSLCQAVSVSGLYEATVPVADQSSKSQSTGIRAALLQVIIKLTGKRNAASIYGVDSILENTNRYLQQYEFRNITIPETGDIQKQLWARFDASVLESEMLQYGIPIWSQERPSTLIWMVINDELGQRFANLDRASRYLQILNEQAAARGISFVTPLHDLQDASTLKDSDIVGGLLEPVKQASSRYVADTILTANINSVGLNLWEAEWTSIINNENRNWTTSGSSVVEVISEGVDALADTLSGLYSQDVGFANESSFDIIVTGVQDFRAYAKTLRYLESLNFISSVDVKQVNSNSITYMLTARGGPTAVEQAASLSNILQPAGDRHSFRYNQ